jgi:tetratricopeptide (TPR) repeat protein
VRGLSARAAFLFGLGLIFFFGSTSSLAQDAPSPPPSGTSADAAAPFVRAHRVVSTASPSANAAFDDGLTLLYAFNPEEARVSFRRALDADPKLAIAWWGVAMSYGTNINTSFDGAAQRNGRDAIRHARELEGGATPIERALIHAAEARFAFDRDADADRSARAYRDAMYAAASDAPDDDDVQTLAAESEMDVHAWSYFTPDGTPTAGTTGIVARLQTVLARDPAHIGAEHLLIHALEESPHPEGALEAARRLAADRFEPAAEHLMHMPAHTFMRVGLYHDAGEANARAVDAYRSYLAGTPAGHRDYFGHDCVFGVDAFTMSGEYARARTLALACDRGRGGLLAVVDLRFRRFDLLASDDQGALGAGMLAARDGRANVADAQLAILRKDRDDVGRISAAVLAAAIASGRGDRDTEIAELTRAVAIQDREGYSEPPEFWMPVGEELGAAEYRAGRFDAAEATFRATIAHDRDDPRALFGLARTLEREGRTEDARAIDARFENAWRQADVSLDMKDL